MNCPLPILTDSGGYQVMSLSKLNKIDREKGAIFNSHVDGKLYDSFRLVRFLNQDHLQKLGRGFFAPVNKDDLPKVSADIQIKQGMLEDSNVNSMLEMTRMISATRAYESVHKALSRIDRLDEKAISMVQA